MRVRLAMSWGVVYVRRRIEWVVDIRGIVYGVVAIVMNGWVRVY